MSEHAPVGLLTKINNPDLFQRSVTPESLLAEGRKIIDRVDPNIVGFMANFRLQANPSNDIELPQSVQEKLDDAPRDFLIALAKFVDFRNMNDEIREKNLATLAGFVAQRFTAISLVAHSKKMNGEETPFHPVRHREVLEAKAQEIAMYAGDAELGQKAFCEFMQAGCVFQKAYMTGDQPEASAKVEARLQKLGITPL